MGRKVNVMAKTTVNLGGKDVVLDMGRPGVAEAVASLIKLAAERRFPIGTIIEHDDGDGCSTDYLLTRIKQAGGSFRAYLVNTETGRARNSTKVVMVKDADVEGGYVTDLPAVKDRFIDEETGEYIDC